LDKICSAKVIFESDLVQDFLCLNNEPSRSDPLPNIVPPTSSVLSDTIKIIVQLPDLSVNTFSLSETARTPDLLDVILSDLNVERKWRKYFAIFIQKEGNFSKFSILFAMYIFSILVVKLLDSDFPYQIYLQNKDSTPAGGTCLLLRKWLFSVSHEMELLEDEIVCDLLYNEALTNITNGLININDEDANLRMLKAQGKKKQYMQLLHKLPSYNTLSFPHCKCDARKTGHIILLLNTTGLSLKACSEEGVLEVSKNN
jgi:sorting nexin-27